MLAPFSSILRAYQCMNLTLLKLINFSIHRKSLLGKLLTSDHVELFGPIQQNLVIGKGLGPHPAAFQST